jgi:hypothetical protein
MNLEQAIRGHWALFEPLTGLVPMSRFWTGVAPPGAELPFVVLEVVRVEAKLTTTSGRLVQHAVLRFSVYAAEHAAANDIAWQIERHFERAGFALAAGSVLDMRRERMEQRVGADGVWTVALDYLAITEHFPEGD